MDPVLNPPKRLSLEKWLAQPLAGNRIVSPTGHQQLQTHANERGISYQLSTTLYSAAAVAAHGAARTCYTTGAQCSERNTFYLMQAWLKDSDEIKQGPPKGKAPRKSRKSTESAETIDPETQAHIESVLSHFLPFGAFESIEAALAFAIDANVALPDLEVLAECTYRFYNGGKPCPNVGALIERAHKINTARTASLSPDAPDRSLLTLGRVCLGLIENPKPATPDRKRKRSDESTPPPAPKKQRITAKRNPDGTMTTTTFVQGDGSVEKRKRVSKKKVDTSSLLPPIPDPVPLQL